MPLISGTANSLLSLTDLPKHFPVLAKVLPATFTQATAKPGG